MTRLVAYALVVGVSAVLGCEADGEVEVEDVVTLEVCPADLADGCSSPRAANGASEVLLRVCCPLPEERRSDLVATLTTSSGSFKQPKDAAEPTVKEVSLGKAGCSTAMLVLPQTAGHIRVNATLEGYTDSEWVMVSPAAIGPISIVPSAPALETGEASSIELQVQAWDESGASVSSGTRAKIALAITPENAYAVAFPSNLVLDDSGQAKFTLHTTAQVSEVTATISVEPPKLRGSTEPTGKTETITLKSPANPEPGPQGGAGG